MAHPRIQDDGLLSVVSAVLVLRVVRSTAIIELVLAEDC